MLIIIFVLIEGSGSVGAKFRNYSRGQNSNRKISFILHLSIYFSITTRLLPITHGITIGFQPNHSLYYSTHSLFYLNQSSEPAGKIIQRNHILDERNLLPKLLGSNIIALVETLKFGCSNSPLLKLSSSNIVALVVTLKF